MSGGLFLYYYYVISYVKYVNYVDTNLFESIFFSTKNYIINYILNYKNKNINKIMKKKFEYKKIKIKKNCSYRIIICSYLTSSRNLAQKPKEAL